MVSWLGPGEGLAGIGNEGNSPLISTVTGGGETVEGDDDKAEDGQEKRGPRGREGKWAEHETRAVHHERLKRWHEAAASNRADESCGAELRVLAQTRNHHQSPPRPQLLREDVQLHDTDVVQAALVLLRVTL